MKFQTFWGGRRITPYEVLCLRSFTGWGHEVDLYTYNHELVPKLPGVIMRDARDVMPRGEYREETEFFRGHPGVFSDEFRYTLLWERGGWWIDTDVMLLAQPPELGMYFAHQDAERVNNAVLCFEPQHPVLLACRDGCRKLRKSGEAKWGYTGPHLLTRVLAQQNLLWLSARPRDCYPIEHEDAMAVLLPHYLLWVQSVVQHSTFLHLWNASLVGMDDVDKWVEPPEGSWLSGKVNDLLGDGEWAIWRRWEAGWKLRERYAS